MNPSVGAPSQRRAFPRIPLRAKARMEFSEQRCFLSEWAVNLSPGGMFVRSEAAMASGQRFDFEASLTPKGPLFGGSGEVLWVRREWEGSARPPGFAVRFLELDEEGRAAIERLAAVFLDQGVAAMQEELATMTAAFQRRRLDDESTDELAAPLPSDEPLPVTAVIANPFPPPADEEDAEDLPQIEAEASRPAAAKAPRVDDTMLGTPLSLPGGAARSAIEEPPGPAAAGAGRRRAWWIAVLALALLGTGFLALHGPRAASPAAPVTAGGQGPVPLGEREAPPAAGPPAGAATFGGLDSVTWSEGADGLSVVLALDGPLPAAALRRYRLRQDPPREVIQLLGARRGYLPAVVPVHTALLQQIRVGFHPGESTGDELRVVLDLTSPAVVVRSLRSDGRSLRVLLVRDAGAAPAAAPAGVAPAAAEPAAGLQPAAGRGAADEAPAHASPPPPAKDATPQ
ncbi:MAG TPA: PilZ domain-containing protein [Thermoanaerobaculia bacterium]|nr:PilZ domain-containing protein [Thermoanaerobaculia bacterium]